MLPADADSGAAGRTLFDQYRPFAHAFDEMFEANGSVRGPYRRLFARLCQRSVGDLEQRQREADATFVAEGITFAPAADAPHPRRVLPSDLLPRILTSDEWQHIRRGLTQRLQALNLFLRDAYGVGRIFAAGVVPRALVLGSPHYRAEMRTLAGRHETRISVAGADLVRLPDGTFAVLEDNVRIPSGVSYMLANRRIVQHVFPQIFADYGIEPIEHYPSALLATLHTLAPPGVDDPAVAVLTPGPGSTAYFEHAYLASQMRVPLVEGRDLVVRDQRVYRRTAGQVEPVDVLYRRIDDEFLDPLVFRTDSQLGTAGLFNAYRAGRVSLANAIGAGIADDKAVYAYVPAIIRYYLGETPLLPNVETFLLTDAGVRREVFDRMRDLVVKPVGESGGYGMLIGPESSAAERAIFQQRIDANPRGYIAQPVLSLSTAPTLVTGRVEPRHVDLRPFVLCDAEGCTVHPGGLTRVAPRPGSLVVNSSQGGGSKDTWVLRPGVE